jgi:hypothetical protein
MLAHRLLPTSPRRRRRLLWTARTLVVVVAVALAVVLMPHGEKVPQTALRAEAADTAPARAPLRLTPARRRETDTLVRRFAIQAAGRRDPAAAWNDASAAMHAGVERSDWNAGNLPGVVPYDTDALRSVSWRVVYREPDRLGLDVLLVARPGTAQRTTVYAVDLVLERGRLLVDSWAPRETFAAQAPTTTTRTETTAAPAEPQPAHGKLDTRWLLIPAGVLALAVLVPLALLVRHAIRTRRAYRRYAPPRRGSSDD